MAAVDGYSLSLDGAGEGAAQYVKGAHKARLEEQHGEGLVVQQGAAAGAGFASTLIELTIQPEAGSIIHMPAVKKKLPHTMLIKDLKLFCHAVFGKKLAVGDMKLCFIDPDQPIGSVFDLSDEYRELGFFGVAEGCEIRVDECDHLKEAALATILKEKG